MKKGHFKKLLASIFAAAMLVCVLLVPGFAKTDAEKELEAANAQVTALEQKVADCQAAMTEAQAQNRRGSYGFFQWAGSKSAMEALDNAKYKNLIAYGTAGDATSLDNLMAALDLVDKVNEKRKADGLKELVVTDTMMAMAEADADAYYDLNTAPKQFTVNGAKIAENLGTFADAAKAADSWYAEKKVADEHPDYMSYSSPNWSQVGHYFNMSSKKYTITGVGANSRPRAGTKFCQVYFSSANGEKTYTTKEYRERIAEYRVFYDDRKEDLQEAQAALQEARVRQATAQRIVNAEQQASATTTTTAKA
ncbi:MAG: hypothetical protein IJ241_06075 [Clostridia bacterium]|nr:hypothetical protein [Clostridia bacterium]